MKKTCCFSGHRNIENSILQDLKNRLYNETELLIKSGIEKFCCGGALGFDTLAEQTVLALKKSYPHIRLILILPYVTQHKSWTEEEKTIYKTVLSEADEVIYTSEKYFRGCMHKRNRCLVDKSSVCISYLNKKTGGTAYTVSYAKKKGLKVINLCGE